MPVGLAAAPVASMRDMGTAGAPGLTDGRPRSNARPERPATAGRPLSATDPQVWHSPQRPAHLVLCQPHSAQANSVPAEPFAMPGTVSAGAGSPGLRAASTGIPPDVFPETPANKRPY